MAQYAVWSSPCSTFTVYIRSILRRLRASIPCLSGKIQGIFRYLHRKRVRQRPKSAVKSRRCDKVPYVEEQGIFLAEQGLRIREQGMARPELRAPGDCDHP